MNKNFLAFSVREIALVGLFAAITAVFAQISIPMVPVPFSLSILGVMLAATVLNPKLAVTSQIVYILLGCAGAPIFSGFQGGIQRVFGPTGGFLASYILMAYVIGTLLNKIPSLSFKYAFFANVAGLLCCYIMGSLWLSYSMKLDLEKTLMSAVLPFVPLDLVKAAISAVLGKRLRKATEKVNI